MEIFQEKGNEESEQSIEIKLRRNSDNGLSSWEISNFIAQFSSNYYKEELINTIGLAFKQGIDPENIFIMEQSFSLNNAYSRIGLMSLKKLNDIKSFYYLGNPITIYPNEKIYTINLVFKMFRKTNQSLYSKGKIRISKDLLIDLMIIVHKNGKFDDIIMTIKDTAITLAFKSIKVKKEYEKVKSNINTYEKSILEEYKQFNNNLPQIEVLKKSIQNNDLELMDSDNYSKIRKTYFDKFYHLITNLSRPVVGIYYKEDNKVQILCSTHINKEKRNKRFLDMRALSHNSPLCLTFVAGLSLLVTAAVGYKAISLRRRKEKTIKETERIMVETTRTRQEVLDIIRELKKSEEMKAIETISNNYISEKFVLIRKTNRKKGKTLLERYKFEVEDSQIAK